jgi:hypothetical protein
MTSRPLQAVLFLWITVVAAGAVVCDSAADARRSAAVSNEAAVVGARATITLRVIVDHLGTVAEVRTVGAPVLGSMSPPSPSDEGALTGGLLALVRSAKESVGQWP